MHHSVSHGFSEPVYVFVVRVLLAILTDRSANAVRAGCQTNS